MKTIHTRVGIVGAGPAGLLLSHLLYLHNIDSIIVEKCSRDYVERRIRAGHLEPATVAILTDAGVGGRLNTTGLHHTGVRFHYEGATHRLNLNELTGESVTIFGQHEICRDLIAARLESNGEIIFDAEDVSLFDIESGAPSIRFRRDQQEIQLQCDFIAGCDGFHGVSRRAMGASLKAFDWSYPFSWLGILAKARPVADELIYAPHDRGLALFSMRSRDIVRLYLQTDCEDSMSEWPDCRIWDELNIRLEGYEGEIIPGEILDRSQFPLRSYVAEPMQLGRLFLAGDAAHIVPPSAAKGMNLAIADAAALSQALERYFNSGDSRPLDSYSNEAAARVWAGQRFSHWMTSLLHRPSGACSFDRRIQVAELDHLFSSEVAAKSFAESYVGRSPAPCLK